MQQKVKGGLRSKIVSSALNEKIKEKYTYKKVNDYLPFFDTYVTDSILKRKWRYDTIPSSMDKVLFTIGNKELRYNDFAVFLNDRQKQGSSFRQKKSLLSSFYDEFETAELKTYFKENLEFENEEYAATINEYRSGLLIFDVMNKNIWRKAKNDSIGLKEFYDNKKEKYLWKERVEAVIYSATNNSTADQIVELLQAGKSVEDIKTQLNTNDKVNVIISEGIFEKGKRELPEVFVFKTGISKVYQKNSDYVVVNVKEVIPVGVKELNVIKGKVMSDYQDFLETKWMEELRAKYKVEINKRALKKIKKEFDS